MRKHAKLCAALVIPFFMFGCGKSSENAVSSISTAETEDYSPAISDATDIGTTAAESESEKETGRDTKILVAYFSATGTTRPIAEKIANVTGGDLFEIIPAEPYTAEDLDYNNDNCRANQEQNDDTVRPKISGTVEKMDEYDVVFIGHPIWWSKEPRIVDTFLESYDFSGKTMVDFCTSGGSGITQSESNLKEKCPDSVWLDGKRFDDSNEVAEWIEALNLNR